MNKLIPLYLMVILVTGAVVLAAPSTRTMHENKTISRDDFSDDEDDLLEQFLNGIKADLPPQNSSSNSTETSSPKLILISFDGFRWDYLDNHTLFNITK